MCEGAARKICYSVLGVTRQFPNGGHSFDTVAVDDNARIRWVAYIASNLLKYKTLQSFQDARTSGDLGNMGVVG